MFKAPLLLCAAGIVGNSPPPPAIPAKICFELPGIHPIRVTVAAVDKVGRNSV